jgi:tellurite resistance protein TerC
VGDSAVLCIVLVELVLGDFVFDGRMPAEISLAVTATLLARGVVYSLLKTRFENGLKKTP